MSEPMTSLLADRPNDRGLASDKDLLGALGMTETEAAAALGRSRQSLYQAALSDRTDYFKKSDLVALLFAARSRDPALDFEPVYDYLQRSRARDPNLVRDLKAMTTAEGDEATLARYGELWIVLPDLAYLQEAHPEATAMMVRLAGRPGARTRFYCATDQDADLLRQTLPADAASAPQIQVEPWMSAFPYGVIADPKRSADYYVFAGGRFLKHDWYGGQKLAMLLENFPKGQLVGTI
ncbi:MAG: hypothetical protein EPO51_04255 [Phenylobacterium sp.]|uniref:hypothetical protein n=1 Tax=Phenylobacterium sp. TaxID=1871053 RepID=UPI00120D8665|nr:hypothetical protein [Phenylobacterium sp.]TAJ73696.1 MAG: hypothetical protein EPO51_04255 [Phenylobacterium sp.]